MESPLKHTAEQYQQILGEIQRAIEHLRDARAFFAMLEPSIATRGIDEAIGAATGECQIPASMLRKLHARAVREEQAQAKATR